MSEILIGNRVVGDGGPPFVIAEAGINHNGDVTTALKMIKVAKQAGADAVKFQTFSAETLVGDPEQMYTYRSRGQQMTESMLEMFRRCELPRSAWFDIKAECDRVGII